MHPYEVLVFAALGADCTNATGTLCKHTVGGEVLVKGSGSLGTGESGPITVTVSYPVGGGKSHKASTTAQGSGKSANVSTNAPSDENTEVTVTVKGSNCGPTDKQTKKMKDITDC